MRDEAKRRRPARTNEEESCVASGHPKLPRRRPPKSQLKDGKTRVANRNPKAFRPSLKALGPKGWRKRTGGKTSWMPRGRVEM